MSPQLCGAAGPRIRDPGWECTGRGLIVVARFKDLPVVLPARALDAIDAEDWWDDPLVAFEGGDHLHLVVPRRPPPVDWRSNCTVQIGDAVSPGMFTEDWRWP